MTAYLIDTNWIIDHFNRVAKVTRRLDELQGQGLAVSVITVAELWDGVYFSRDPRLSEARLVPFLSGVVILPVSEEICKRFGQLRGSLRNQGRILADFDLLIAASALIHNLTLLTNDRRHFDRIEGLRIESIDA